MSASANSTPGESSSPTDSANAASLEQANNNAFARAGVPGAAAATTSRANAAAAGETERGENAAIAAAVPADREASLAPAPTAPVRPDRTLDRPLIKTPESSQ